MPNFLAFETPETREVMGTKLAFELRDIGFTVTLAIHDGDRHTMVQHTVALSHAFMLRDFLNRHLVG